MNATKDHTLLNHTNIVTKMEEDFRTQILEKRNLWAVPKLK